MSSYLSPNKGEGAWAATERVAAAAAAAAAARAQQHPHPLHYGAAASPRAASPASDARGGGGGGALLPSTSASNRYESPLYRYGVGGGGGGGGGGGASEQHAASQAWRELSPPRYKVEGSPVQSASSVRDRTSPRSYRSPQLAGSAAAAHHHRSPTSRVQPPPPDRDLERLSRAADHRAQEIARITTQAEQLSSKYATSSTLAAAASGSASPSQHPYSSVRFTKGMRVRAASELTVRKVRAVAVGDLGVVYGPSDDTYLPTGVNVEWDHRRDGGSRRINVLPSDIELCFASPQPPPPLPTTAAAAVAAASPLRLSPATAAATTATTPTAAYEAAAAVVAQRASPLRGPSSSPSSPQDDPQLQELEHLRQEAQSQRLQEEARMRTMEDACVLEEARLVHLSRMVKEEEDRLTELQRQSHRILQDRESPQRQVAPPSPRAAHPDPEAAQPPPPPTPQRRGEGEAERRAEEAEAEAKSAAVGGVPTPVRTAASAAEEEECKRQQQHAQRLNTPPTHEIEANPMSALSTPHKSSKGGDRGSKRIHFERDSDDGLSLSVRTGDVDPRAPCTQGGGHHAHGGHAHAHAHAQHEQELSEIREYESVGESILGHTAGCVSQHDKHADLPVDPFLDDEEMKLTQSVVIAHDQAHGTDTRPRGASQVSARTGTGTPAVWMSMARLNSVKHLETKKSLLSRKGSLGMVLSKLADEGCHIEDVEQDADGDEMIDEAAVWWQVPRIDVSVVTFLHPAHGEPPGATTAPREGAIVSFDLRAAEGDGEEERRELRLSIDGALQEDAVKSVTLERTEHGVFLLFAEASKGPVPDRVVAVPPENMNDVVAGVVCLAEKANIPQHLVYEYEALANQEAIVERYLQDHCRVPKAFVDSLLPPDHLKGYACDATIAGAAVVALAAMHKERGSYCSVM